MDELVTWYKAYIVSNLLSLNLMIIVSLLNIALYVYQSEWGLSIVNNEMYDLFTSIIKLTLYSVNTKYLFNYYYFYINIISII